MDQDQPHDEAIERLRAIRALLEAATPGPMHVFEEEPGGPYAIQNAHRSTPGDGLAFCERRADAELIAASWTEMDAMCEALRSVRSLAVAWEVDPETIRLGAELMDTLNQSLGAAHD